MDPKLSNLDPKLKEAYDRVMGGPTPPSPPPANPNPEPVPPPVEPSPPPMSPPPPPPPMPGASAASETVHIGPVGPATMQPPPMPTPTEAVKPYPNQVLHAEKGSKISPLIIVVLVFVFLISYTL